MLTKFINIPIRCGRSVSLNFVRRYCSNFNETVGNPLRRDDKDETKLVAVLNNLKNWEMCKYDSLCHVKNLKQRLQIEFFF